jgi:hypothetical protein
MLLGKHTHIYFVWCSSKQQMHDICAVCSSVKAVQSSGAGANPCLLVAVLCAASAKALRKHQSVPQPVRQIWQLHELGSQTQKSPSKLHIFL